MAASPAGEQVHAEGDDEVRALKALAGIASKTAIVGEWSSAQLFVGDDFRVDTSSEASTRFDQSLTGFRGEEEIGFNADPYVSSGIFQMITGLIP